MAFTYVPFDTDIFGLAARSRRGIWKNQELGEMNDRRSYVQSSCLKTSSKKGTPATMPGLFPRSFASAIDPPTTNPP